jgi:Effector-associated domain 4
MAIKGNKSHGQDTQSKVRRVLVAILDYADGEASDARKSRPMVCRWADDGRLVVNDALVNTILHRVNANKGLTDLSADDVKRSFGDWVALQIFTDRRGSKTQGVSLWQFDLKFQAKERQAVLAEFDRLWEAQWSPNSPSKPAAEVSKEPISAQNSESSVAKPSPIRNSQTTSGDAQGVQVNDSQGTVIAGSNPVVNIPCRGIEFRF